MLGIPYSRVSSTEQASGLGLERQAADPLTYCKQRGWQLYEGPGYSDAGVSAYGGKNLHDGALGRFLADAKAGRFGSEPIALLIEDLDRFSRAMPLAILPVLIDDLLNAGMTISVMGKGRDISRASIKANPMELHELLFWLGASHEFSEKLSKRISHVHETKRQQIREGRAVTPESAPAWIDLGPDGEWVLNDYAQVIRRLLAMAAEGHGCHSIATTLNREGIPSPGQVRRNQWAQGTKRPTGKSYKPVVWSSSSVRQVITNPAVVGHRQIVTPGHKARLREWGEHCAQLRRQGVADSDLPKAPPRTYEAPVAGYYPALINESEQAGLVVGMQRRQIKTEGRIDQVRWIAAGLTRCTCGHQMGAIASRRSGGYRYYLACRSRHHQTGCNQPAVRLLDAQANLLTRLTAETFLGLLDGDQSSKQATALASAISAQAIAQSALDQLTAAIEAGEQAMALEADPAVLGVLAKRQAQQEAKQQAATQALMAARADLQRLQCARPLAAIGQEAQDRIRQLLQTFAIEADSVDDRRAVQLQLRRLGLVVHVDGATRQLGLQVTDGPIEWAPIRARLDQAGLAAGMSGSLNVDLELDAETMQGLEQVPELTAGVVDLGAAFAEVLGEAKEGAVLIDKGKPTTKTKRR